VGRTLALLDEKAAREVWVCGPGAFVVLKALAFRGRGENKDAYDLYYLVRNFGSGVDDVAACLRPLLGDDEAKKALQVLRDDFLDHDAIDLLPPAKLHQIAKKYLDLKRDATHNRCFPRAVDS